MTPLPEPSVLDSFGLDGRPAVVTGGAGPLGQEFVRTRAEAGARTVVADIDIDGARRAASGRVTGITVSTDDEAIAEAAKAAAAGRASRESVTRRAEEEESQRKEGQTSR